MIKKKSNCYDSFTDMLGKLRLNEIPHFPHMVNTTLWLELGLGGIYV